MLALQLRIISPKLLVDNFKFISIQMLNFILDFDFRVNWNFQCKDSSSHAEKKLVRDNLSRLQKRDRTISSVLIIIFYTIL